MNNLTLGSLFDGSGGFPLAGKICGIEPVGASEVEPFPIAVTRKRFPNMKHYGNVCDINGAKVEPVDIVTFGSPCQDLSVAGKRAGIEGDRSNLFYEAIRIIKEMRRVTNEKYPRYAVWENVPGAFSSNRGRDFLAVLQSFCDTAKPGISIPRCEKWRQSGAIYDNKFSLAWRVLDAQFWGVPQRRKRIFLVCDFNGQSAYEILFKQESLQGNYREVQEAWKRFTESPRESAYKAIRKIEMYENHSQDCRYKKQKKTCPTNELVVLNDQGGERIDVYKDKSGTLKVGGNTAPVVLVRSSQALKEKANILVSSDYKEPPLVGNQYIVRRMTPKECARLQGFPVWWCDNLGIEEPTESDIKFWRKVFNTYGEINGQKKQKTNTQIKKWLTNPHTDSAEYKMGGNGLALPCVLRVLSGITNYLGDNIK